MLIDRRDLSISSRKYAATLIDRKALSISFYDFTRYLIDTRALSVGSQLCTRILTDTRFLSIDFQKVMRQLTDTKPLPNSSKTKSWLIDQFINRGGWIKVFRSSQSSFPIHFPVKRGGRFSKNA